MDRIFWHISLFVAVGGTTSTSRPAYDSAFFKCNGSLKTLSDIKFAHMVFLPRPEHSMSGEALRKLICMVFDTSVPTMSPSIDVLEQQGWLTVNDSHHILHNTTWSDCDFIAEVSSQLLFRPFMSDDQITHIVLISANGGEQSCQLADVVDVLRSDVKLNRRFLSIGLRTSPVNLVLVHRINLDKSGNISDYSNNTFDCGDDVPFACRVFDLHPGVEVDFRHDLSTTLKDFLQQLYYFEMVLRDAYERLSRNANAVKLDRVDAIFRRTVIEDDGPMIIAMGYMSGLLVILWVGLWVMLSPLTPMMLIAGADVAIMKDPNSHNDSMSLDLEDLRLRDETRFALPNRQL